MPGNWISHAPAVLDTNLYYQYQWGREKARSLAEYIVRDEDPVHLELPSAMAGPKWIKHRLVHTVVPIVI